MANYRKRGNVWQVQVRRQGWPARSATFDTKTEAETWAVKTEGEMKMGRFRDTREAEKITLSDALDRYLREVTQRKRGAKQEIDRILTWKKKPLARRTLISIRGKDIADFIDSRRASGVSDQTIRLDLEVISHLYTIARIKWGIEGLENPVQLTEKPKPSPHRQRRLEAGEEERLLAVASPRLRPIIEFALETGMRRGAIRSLKWSQVNLARRIIRFSSSETKNSQVHEVPLSSKAADVLRSLPRRLDGLVFGLDGITDSFERTCKKAEIKGLTFHDLRHECLSRLAEKGFDIPHIAAVSGHRSWAALKRYVNLRAEDVARKLG